MNKHILTKMVDALIEIKGFITQFPTAKFKIGKTNDYQRRQKEHELDGYTHFQVIAESTSLEDINELEQVLIKFSTAFYKDNIENERNGKGGNISNSNNYYIYLISKSK
ncbi:MAG: GIY-YIG nuclease family protein [Bacteroidales bacterium]|nr:GIY-YIG nuclease family protein [Bacteroidales bacterium]